MICFFKFSKIHNKVIRALIIKLNLVSSTTKYTPKSWLTKELGPRN